jgi:hypothetical protein
MLSRNLQEVKDRFCYVVQDNASNHTTAFKECAQSLKLMTGSDGYTVDFYKFFWEDIGPLLYRSLYLAYESGSFTDFQSITAEAILRSVFNKLIGLQFPIKCLSFPSFGIHVMTP